MSSAKTAAQNVMNHTNAATNASCIAVWIGDHALLMTNAVALYKVQLVK